MNKRIKKLLNEATSGHEQEHDRLKVMTVSDKEMDKFAELIVQKCMDIAKYHTPDTEECEYTWLIHDKIQEYFGVEE
jgi:exonuclease III